MPELPDLEVIKGILNEKIVGKPIAKIQVLQPLVLRCYLEELIANFEKRHVVQVERRGKFLIFHSDSGAKLVIHLMLAGRLQLCTEKEKPKRRTCLRMIFADEAELRYLDNKLMGRVYLVKGDDFSHIPQFPEMGPDPFDQNLSLQNFGHRLKKHRGTIKSVLTNQKFLAGIGNAYADEILFCAGILPFRKRSTLSLQEIERLYGAVFSVLTDAINTISKRVRGDIHIELRDFLRVHNKGGQQCPNCGGRLSETTANKQITSYCRNCQG